MRHPTWLFPLLLFAAGCSPGGPSPPAVPPGSEAPPADPAPVEVAGLHNVYRITDKLYSGSGPEGEESFRSLQELGVQTIISVDGARPDVRRARDHGMRYVHLPIGYDGVPEEQGWRIAKAVRDLPGPVYLHCHHGKHRGPAAAAVARLCLDETCTVEAALQVMERAGTDPRYTGLYAAPRTLRRPTNEALDRVPADFPEVAAVTALAQTMVRIDQHWEHLRRVRQAGWKTPPGHPDLDPPHEAVQLTEQYREAVRLTEDKNSSEELRRWLAAAEAEARDLEQVLRQGKENGRVDAAAAEASFRAAAAACTRCHARYRDVPQPPR